MTRVTNLNNLTDAYLVSLSEMLNSRNIDSEISQKCIAYASRLRENKLPVLFDRDHLAFELDMNIAQLTHFVANPNAHYSIYSIPKKKGGQRCINAPSLELKMIQRWILDNVLPNMKVSVHAYGFVKGKSIVDNASCHLGKHCIVSMDLKDFFPSVKADAVFRIFSYYGYSNEVAFYLSRLCTLNDSLPQGSPTSPSLSNIAFLRADKRLAALADSFEATYTRYADDITFSGKGNLKKIIPIVEKILIDEGFALNSKKTRVAFNHQSQRVTGLIVNGDEVRVPKSFKRKLFQELHYCSLFGVDSHMKHEGIDKMFYKEHLYGKAYFLLMVEHDLGIKALDILDSLYWSY